MNQAFAGYVLLFFNDIEMLLRQMVLYDHEILKLEQARKAVSERGDMLSLAQEDAESIKVLSQGIHALIRTSAVRFSALAAKLPEFSKRQKNFEGAYKKVKSKYLPDVREVEAYAQILHEAFVEALSSESLAEVAQSLTDMMGGGFAEGDNTQA